MLSSMYCEKLKTTPGNSLLNSVCTWSVNFSLVMPLGPLVKRLQRREQLDIRERRGIAAVVRPAMLRDQYMEMNE